jgi:hypothetical protein
VWEEEEIEGPFFPFLFSAAVLFSRAKFKKKNVSRRRKRKMAVSHEKA